MTAPRAGSPAIRHPDDDLAILGVQLLRDAVCRPYEGRAY